VASKGLRPTNYGHRYHILIMTLKIHLLGFAALIVIFQQALAQTPPFQTSNAGDSVRIVIVGNSTVCE
jgi:hypothetical protein